MNSSNIWISLFIEHCLSSYETRRQDSELSWEDDGSNIRFSTPIQRCALINTWKERDLVPIANLTDSDTQIDAFLSRESLEEYSKDFPTQPLSKDGCRGYSIQLTDFELVYEYSTGKPKVHLYVMRFSIKWEQDRIRAAPTGKSAAKKPALATLIRRIFSSIKSQSRRRQETHSATADNNGYSNGYKNGYDDIPATQAIDSSTIHPVEPHLMSQLPPRPSINAPHDIQTHDVAPSGKLLEHLAQIRSPEGRHQSRERSMNARSLNPEPAHEARPRSASRISISGNENRRLHEPQREKLAADSDGSLMENANSNLPGSQTNADQPSPQESAGEVTIRTGAKPHSPEKVVERLRSPYSPQRELSTQLEASQNVTLRSPNPSKTGNSSIIDPWEGMTEIRSIDVTVPKDQMELLDADKKPWYPPPVGEQTVSGHVPPALLNEWNKLVSHRRQEGGESRSKSVDDEHLTNSSTRTSETPSDSDSECEWEESPERTPRRGRLLPLDSSPVRDDSVHSQKPRNMDLSDQDGHTKVADLKSQDAKENNPAPQVDQDLQPRTPPRAPEVEPSERSATAIVLDIARDDDDGHESDGSSSDSEMSFSVPQPLSGSTQQEMSSQEEATVSSSGPSLPGSARQNVQVVETPAAAHNKSHPAIFNLDGFGTGVGNVEPQSQAHKSSSQSCVRNTYASHDEITKEETSQENSISLPTNEPDTREHVLVIGTPFSSQGVVMQPTPQSGSKSAWTSSGPRIVEGSVAAASTYQSQSSNAFSSYRDLPPSSMMSVEGGQRSPSVLSSARGTPIKLDRASPLKRFASEIGDSEYGSPSKRIKVDRMPTGLRFKGGLNERIISRRQSYIINSAQSIEASRVYEKFRNDYPSYAGDFEHFTKQCSRLQTVRQGGSLQRSFLWDDFIIKHLEDYPRYLAECFGNETKYLDYEEYFVSFFSRPIYKKRSLTAEGISACAAQIITINDTRASSASSRPMADTETSFTGSLRDQFSNFHAHSFAEPQDRFSHDGQSEAGHSETSREWNSSQYSIPDSEPARTAAQKDNNEEMELDHTTQETATTATTQDDNDQDIEEIDIDSTAYETASIELGDDKLADQNKVPTNPTPEVPASDAEIDTDEDNDNDDDLPVNENWFLSLRHIHPTKPVWSDDPNTPFKKWARADQDVLSVRNRRGGVKVPIDEKGVIQLIPRK